MPILYNFVSGFQKCPSFLCTTIRNAIICIKKCDVINFTCFFCLCIAINRDIALEFCMRVVCMCLDHIYSGSLDELEILDFIGNYF